MSAKHFHLAETNIRRDWGETAFARLGETIQKALLAQEYLALVAAQDDSIDAERIRAMVNEGLDLLSTWTWASKPARRSGAMAPESGRG